MPAAAAFIGVSFMICTLLISGLPPLSGFVGKFAMLTTLLNPLGLGTSNGIQAGWQGWAMVALLIVTGLMALIALTRAGIRHFWANPEQSAPSLKVAEGLPIAALLLCCVALTVKADDVMRYTQRAANALHSPDVYVSTVMGQTPVPAPKDKKALDAESPEAAARAAAREMQDEPAPGIAEPESESAESLPTLARKEGGQS